MSEINNTQSPREKLSQEKATAKRTGPYVLHSILDDVPLSEDGVEKSIFITCVEFWSE